MYKNITINGFRGIKHLQIDDFQQINLFVGKNNCGKTTILEGIFLLMGATNAGLPVKINSFRGFNIIDEKSWRLNFNKLDADSTIEIFGELKNPNEKRKLLIKPSTKPVATIIKNTIDKETIDIKDIYSGLSPDMDGLILEYSLQKGASKKLKKITTTIKKEDQEIKVELPKDHKEHLKGVFINAKTVLGDIVKRYSDIQIRKQSNKIITVLREIEPSLDSLSLGADEIIYCDIGLNRLMPINVMGDGILRVFSIISAISDMENGIILIDEIENGLHYSSQEILWNAIFKFAKEFNVQVFATTHSMECIKAFSSSYSQIVQNNNVRLYRIERKDDDFKVVSYDLETLVASLDSDWEVR